MYIPPSQMPAHSRIWIYQSNRQLNDTEMDLISSKAISFLEAWTAHDARLKGSFEIRYRRFLILMNDEKAAGVSGCSIDKSVHFIQSLEKELHLSLLDRMLFAVKNNGAVEVF